MDIQKFIDEYISWLKSEITYSEIGEYCEINTPFLDNNNDYLQIYVKQEGNEIYIITARWGTSKDDEKGNKMRETVIKWLCEYKIPYDKLIFVKSSNERKSDEIIENKIDIMIEDNPNNIIELSELIPVICYDASYNKDCENKNIIRCYSWYDIYRKISLIKK